MAKYEFAELIKQQIEQYGNKDIVAETGLVLSIGDGIVQTTGLDNIMLNEIVEFENGARGLALNLEENTVGVVMLDNFEEIKQGDKVKRTKNIASVPVGENLVGRIVDALGRPIDGKGQIKDVELSPIEKVAPGVMARQSVNQPMQTGILAIDSMFPIGKGQRELIIGDRQTGKTTIGLDTIINQKGKDVRCVYVAIGQKNSTVSSVVRTLEEHGAMEYTTIVSSGASDLPALKYLSPFTGITIAEKWMSEGKDVLIIYDDLTKHAVAYRTLSLLLRRPPGREAFPGDVFYLHSRLLERAGRVNEKHGGGSITALPIIETQAGDISAYIPTNVISITDGQLFMMTSLFNSGQRPAVDAGLSVSRVGSAAQTKYIKKFSGSLKVELANYRELDAFSQFGSDLDKATKAVLSHGKRIMAMIRQSRSEPLSQSSEALLLFCIWKKYIKFIPTAHIIDFKGALVKYYAGSEIEKIIKKDDPTEENIQKIDYSIKMFIVQFLEKYDLMKELSENRLALIKQWNRTTEAFMGKKTPAQVKKIKPSEKIADGVYETKKLKTPAQATKGNVESNISAKNKKTPTTKSKPTSKAKPSNVKKPASKSKTAKDTK